MDNLQHAMRLLNETAYAAAKAARKANDPRAAALLKLAHDTDTLFEAKP
jgi:hypothetical protein